MIPFSGHYTADKAAPNNRKRLRQFREFAGMDNYDGVHALDIGAANFLSRQLRIADNTRGDLNKGVNAPHDKYEVVTCLEVLNHVMNPLVLVQGICSLMKPKGKLYLSTPHLGLIAWYHGRGNFTEYKPDRVKKLLEYAGFRIFREKVYNPWPLGFALGRYHGDDYHWLPIPGIRPPFRWLLNRYVIFECEKC